MRSLGLLIIVLLPLSAAAQSLEKLGVPLAEITIENLDLISFDTKDQLFASNTSGDIYLFSADGKQLNLFSPARQGRLTQLEAAWTVNVFSFSADLQQYRILDRFLKTLAEDSFIFSDVNLAKAATLGNNNVLWVWDESDLSLKSIDYQRNLVIQSQPLNLILNTDKLEVAEIREFKNRLFMNVPETGVFIFDNQGNLMRKVAQAGITRMCYYKEHLLWLEEGYLKALSLSTNQVSSLVPLADAEATYLQIGRERFAIVSKDKVSLYATPSWLTSWK
ncbi:hypothetical protein U3A58_05150 [Algoriphagus sp. C2-6-M1]|uniref:hypothetical protein n=1 Tax=Algoriphagus persicinus TaxID=3108754 RepID=UPI002B3E4F06|nr:hypothetical protein [Algoriphagus sp. C2-6-M1]MEB2779772.1 hypothetical protein [Algoriphagus sp. C2-6-M1]